MTSKSEREDLKMQGERLKARIAALAATLNKVERLKLKIALMMGGAGESTARLLMNNVYDKHPRQGLLENMEDVLANFGKAKAAKIKAS